MPIKIYKRTTPGRRNSSVNIRTDLTTSKPEKSLLRPLKKTGGRNHSGVITSRFRGGGHKRMYRLIDFKRTKDESPATVRSIEYDPNRTCNIALVQYEDGEKRYVLAPIGLTVGQTIQSGPEAEPRVGNCLPLSNMPLGMDIHNIELTIGRGGQMVRTAGGSARLVAREGAKVVVADIDQAGGTRIVDEFCDRGGEGIFVLTDVTKASDVQRSHARGR